MSFVPKRLDKTADISAGKNDPREIAGNILGVLLFCVVTYLGLGLVADLAAQRVPTAWENQLAGLTDLAGLGETFSPDSAHPGIERAQPILDRLLTASDLRPLDYSLTVIADKSPNAFALPGGSIVLTTGLLEVVKGEAGLAMVIGHELGHHHHRHVLQKLGRQMFVLVPAMAISGDTARWVGSFLNLLEGKYGRDQEREADREGLELLYAAYGTTEGGLEFFEGMLDEQGEGSRWMTMLKSHPPTTERLQNLREQSRVLAQSRQP